METDEVVSGLNSAFSGQVVTQLVTGLAGEDFNSKDPRSILISADGHASNVIGVGRKILSVALRHEGSVPHNLTNLLNGWQDQSCSETSHLSVHTGLRMHKVVSLSESVVNNG